MIDHIFFDECAMKLIFLDQRSLPARLDKFVCVNCADAISAIKSMVVRGAPAIGVAAAFACVLAAQDQENKPSWQNSLNEQLEELKNARPTAVNLAWAVERMRKAMLLAQPETVGELLSIWLPLAKKIQAEDKAICRRIGEIGETLLQTGDTVLTHCNAGALATAGYGTALAPIRAAVENGKKIRVIADETRPLLQGARLTAWELAQDNIPVSVACDNACSTLMSRGLVQLVIVGADRIAANGDTANKTGTCGVAIIARYYKIPFYIAAPLSTIDLDTKHGAQIPIEQRDEKEVSHIGNIPLMPAGVHAWNFAFDVTPASLIDGIITEAGILRPPYQDSLAEACKGKVENQ